MSTATRGSARRDGARMRVRQARGINRKPASIKRKTRKIR